MATSHPAVPLVASDQRSSVLGRARGAIYWAHLDKIYYANNRKDAAKIGFDDDFIYQEINLKPEDRSKPSEKLLRKEALEVFKKWQNKEDKTEY